MRCFNPRPPSLAGVPVLALHAQGYAQAEVARRLGVSAATVGRLVRGRYQFAGAAHA